MALTAAAPRLGLRANLPQFLLLVAVNALVGGALGQERAVLPLVATEEFGIASYTAALTFVLAFGVSKALTNYVAGHLADQFGRRPVLLAGWVVALPVPLLIMVAPEWWLVVAANVLLGVSQGLTWSMTVTMKVDLVGPARRGLALGLNEAAGYVSVAGTALLTGYLAAEHGLRPWPFAVGLAYAALGLILSTVVRETHGHARHEAGPEQVPSLGSRAVFAETTFRNPRLGSACQAGLVNNLNDALAWGVLPLLFAASGLSLTRVGLLLALYPAVWGLGQIATGALADRLPHAPLIVVGMLVQAGALAVIAVGDSFAVWATASVVLGVGTALVYPTLLAVISDVAHPTWRARALGVYRLWRDLGFAVGALVAGLVADAAGLSAAVMAVAVLTALSGVHAARYLPDRAPRRPTTLTR